MVFGIVAGVMSAALQPAGGPVIGLGRHDEFEEGVLALFPGDRLVLYTDGVAEATSGTRGEFGDEPLMSHLRRNRSGTSSEAAAGLIEAASSFAGGALADDATALVVGVGPGKGVAHVP